MNATTPGRPEPILLLSQSPSGRIRPLQQAAARARFDVHVEASAAHAAGWLASNHPRAILVDGGTSAGERDCLEVRYDPKLANVPILGLADTVTELSFAGTLACGGDDLCERRDGSLARRLRGIALGGDVPLSPYRGRAVVIDADRRGRVLTARALRNAGYDVVFAENAVEGLGASLGAGVELVTWRVGSAAELVPGAMPPAAARASGSVAPWVIGVAPKDVAAVRAHAANLAGVAVYDAFGPPEDVLFVANELTRRSLTDARASTRLLYGAVVSFRAAGAATDEDELGYTYNVGAGGFYVRTLAPPEHGAEIWAELCPPRTQRRVRLEGVVAWKRGFGTNGGATVPPGFGVRITGGSVTDLERYARGYRAFASEVAS